MVSGNIFLFQGDGQLVGMREEEYEAEKVLQKLLAEYPNLLAGDQIDEAEPRKWLLIAREVAIPSEESGGGRWAVDILYLDQDAIPTLVEVKRSRNTEIRREIVGQMLDYAANSVSYLTVEAIQDCFNEYHGDRAEEVLDEFLGDEIREDEFWQGVKTNLQAGRIRLIFVSDEIPPELRRIVAFLNGQMDPAEVLAVEIKQYVGEGLKTLVPKVVGQQERRTPPRGQGAWDKEAFDEEMKNNGRSTTEAGVTNELLEWAEKKSLQVGWGRGKRSGSFTPKVVQNGNPYSIISVRTDGKLTINFGNFRKSEPFKDESMRRRLQKLINEIPGVRKIADDEIERFPGIFLSTLTKPDAFRRFIEALDWVVDEIRKG